MPRTPVPLLSLTRCHYAVSRSSLSWGYRLSKLSSLSPAQAEHASLPLARDAVVHPHANLAQGDPATGVAPPLAGATDKSESPNVIPDPPLRKGRNLVLCFDGTGGEYDEDNSNIVRFFQTLKKDDTSRQMVYYQAGLGTAIDPRRKPSWFPKFHIGVDAVFATGLGRHVRDGYTFIMQNYTEGDRISIFGYSRGAYIARALAGMIHKVGLLPRGNHAQVHYAYQMFKRNNTEGQMSEGFKQTFSADVQIDFVGVFDTVSGFGVFPQSLPFATSNCLIRVFRHALALDERRAEFKVVLWGQESKEEKKQSDDGKGGIFQKLRLACGGLLKCITEGQFTRDPNGMLGSHDSKSGTNKRRGSHSGHKCRSAKDSEPTDVKEVWFAGGHSDVGGGAVPNEEIHHLARIPLRWMIRECFANNTGILFRSEELENIGFSLEALNTIKTVPGNPSALTPNPLTSFAQSGETEDASCPIHDELQVWPPKWWWTPGPCLTRWVPWLPRWWPVLSLRRIGWCILEGLETHRRYAWNQKTWEKVRSAFFAASKRGSPRVIQGPSVRVHRSVQYMMENPDLKYRPKATLPTKPGPTWVY